jgi:thioredoxin-like negative regulator of GroEL
MLQPVFEGLEKKVDNGVKISYIDIDENQQIAMDYGVRSVPTVVIEKDGMEMSRLTGVRSESTYLNELKSIQ